MNISKISTITFLSHEERERALQRLRELERQRELQRQRDEQKLLEKIAAYPKLDSPMSTRVAGFLAQFTCSVQNNSEHNVMEFFGDDKTASDLREKLSPDCQKTSIELRNMIKNMEEFQDPVNTLIVANRMHKFVPKKGILTDEQQNTYIEGIKKVISTSVRNSDFNKFEPEDKAKILKMVQKIEGSDSMNFGIEKMLRELVDKLNSAKLNIGFVPPVQVRNLATKTAQKIIK